MTAQLPIFPLGTVLFPGLVLPLHIFEQRYRTLVRELVARPTADTQEFGVVAIRRGWEVQESATEVALTPAPGQADPGVPDLHAVGCTAELRQVNELPDGRFEIVTVGRRRFRLRSVDAGAAPYLVGEVEWLPEPEADEAADRLAPRVRAAFQGYLRLLRPAGDRPPDTVPDDPTVLSHLVAAGTQLTVEDRQELLTAADTTARLRAELRLLNREAALLRRIRAIPAPLSQLAQPSSRN